MKCPNCGSEMPEGALYCEHCGKDIHIVPDFEPELEENMARAMGRPYDDGTEGEKDPQEKDSRERDPQKSNLQKKESRGKGKRRRFLWVSIGVCLVGLLVAGVAAGIFLYRYHSYEYQLAEAVKYFTKEEYKKSIDRYKRALEIDDQDLEVNFALAEAYSRMGNKVEYEYLLRNIIRNPKCSQDQLERAYGKLITIYRERGEYDTINEILHYSENEAIQKAYQEYLVTPPEFSYEPGYYEEVVPLKLYANAPGRIYYTLDGTDPDENSQLYASPFLFTESVQIKAIFINDYGVASEIVTGEYFINVNLDMDEGGWDEEQDGE